MPRRGPGQFCSRRFSVVARSQEEPLFYANPCICGGMGGGVWWRVEGVGWGGGGGVVQLSSLAT